MLRRRVVGLVVSFPLLLGFAICAMVDANTCAQAWSASRGFPVNA